MNRQTRATAHRGEERVESTMIACLPQEREFGQQLKEGQEKTEEQGERSRERGFQIQ